jgi:prepilin-type processing-associated H-X9-DG protein
MKFSLSGSMPAHRQRMAGVAFTILELLVTIVIIALLATLLFATGRYVTARANSAASAQNLRQWGAALPLYAAENNGAMPRRGQGVQPLGQINRPQDWFNALPPYLGLPTYQDLVTKGERPLPGQHSIFICPGATKPDVDTTAANFMGYGMNMNLSPWNIPTPTMISEVARPGTVVFMGESPGPYASVYPSAAKYSVIAPHAGRGNLLFVDGHVQNFASDYIGCHKGDPGRDDISWTTGTSSDANSPKY